MSCNQGEIKCGAHSMCVWGGKSSSLQQSEGTSPPAAPVVSLLPRLPLSLTLLPALLLLPSPVPFTAALPPPSAALTHPFSSPPSPRKRPPPAAAASSSFSSSSRVTRRP